MNKIGFWSRFTGIAELYAEERYREALLTVIAERGISATVTSDTENNGILVKMSPANAKKIASALDKNNIIVYINSVCGIKNYLLARKNRIGFFVGMLLFFFLLSLSSLFVFRIEIHGNGRLLADELQADLCELGIEVGAKISEIDKKSAAGKLMMRHPEISWAALNVKGTTLCLEIKERVDAPPVADEAPEIIIAQCDGIIKGIAVQSGRAIVGVGSVVRKGDLLISGYVSGSGLQYSENPLLRFDGAKGSVTAEVNGSVSAAVPFTESIVKKTRSKTAATVISVFGKEITVGDVPNENFEKGVKRHVTVMGIIELPITYTEYYFTVETEQTKQRDEAQCLAKAELLAYRCLKDELENAQLNRIEKTIQTDENGVTVTLSYVCEKEIGVPKFRQ